ncbi:MAG: hypothetical protein QOH93_2844 [Chloroflexia bacterium]|jgi:hypothetical protein|nr:hypothetical protein [Chloroflexia bacterium]
MPEDSEPGSAQLSGLDVAGALSTSPTPGSAGHRAAEESNRTAYLLLVLACSILFSLLTAALQAEKLGISYLEEGLQIERHTAVLSGTSGDPWQYRVLSEYLAEGFVIASRALALPHPIAVGFVLFRVLQNLAIFVLAAAYLRRLGFKLYVVLFSLAVLAWGMSQSFYDSDLQFSTYSDIAFYLLAALAILHSKYSWILPITLLAALNRESGVFIPFLVFGVWLFGARRKEDARFIFVCSLLALLCFVAAYVGLRLVLGPRPFVGTEIQHPGISLLIYNVTQPRTWLQLFATLSILPVLAFYSMPLWPRVLKIFFWVLVPAWFVVHFAASIAAETRLFLVPFALVFVPGAAFGLAASGRFRTGGRQPE